MGAVGLSTAGGATAAGRTGSSSTGGGGNGLKFTDFKVDYHSGTLAGMTSRLANKPVELPNDYDAVRRAIDTAEQAHTVSH